MGDETILKLLEVADDVAFRLSKVAKWEKISLRCEISLPNLTLSAAYWDGSPNPIFGCDLTDGITYLTSASEAFIRFPLNFYEKTSQSYILLPSKMLSNQQAFMASGIFIPATSLMEQILPGTNTYT